MKNLERIIHLNKNWIYVSILVIFSLLILMPPILSPEHFLVINNDTQAHLNVFEQIRYGNYNNVLYLGQVIVGIPLLYIEMLTGIAIDKLFMWFNFGALLASGLVISALVFVVTKNKLASVISMPIIVFGIGSTMHLFYSGTIFNIIEMLILFPIFLILIYNLIEKRKIAYGAGAIGILTLAIFFHPSLISGVKYIGNTSASAAVLIDEAVLNPVAAIIWFLGIANLVGIVILAILLWRAKRESINKGTKYIMVGCISLAIITLILWIIGATPFSSRLAINMFLIMGIVSCIGIGIVFNTPKSNLVKAMSVLFTLGIVSGIYTWIERISTW